MAPSFVDLWDRAVDSWDDFLETGKDFHKDLITGVTNLFIILS